VSSRRQFLKQISLGAAAGAVGLPSFAEGFALLVKDPEVIRIALLADSHLTSSFETVAAQNLAAAVKEINGQRPPVDWVFFAGDLTDNGNHDSLKLGRQILAGLDVPCVLIPGEHDMAMAFGRMWQEIFGDGGFSFEYKGVHFLGCSTTIVNPATGTTYFHFTPERERQLSIILPAISPEIPLVICSHAPCYRLFRPWQWWTKNSESLYTLLQGQKQVYLLHGHVHQNITFQYRNLVFQGLRSTAWPLPDVRIGCCAAAPDTREQPSRAGCGWMLLTISNNGLIMLEDRVWS
jgi:Icc protein